MKTDIKGFFFYCPLFWLYLLCKKKTNKKLKFLLLSVKKKGVSFLTIQKKRRVSDDDVRKMNAWRTTKVTWVVSAGNLCCPKKKDICQNYTCVRVDVMVHQKAISEEELTCLDLYVLKVVPPPPTFLSKIQWKQFL